MIRRPSPRKEEASKPDNLVHSHGPETGECDRMIVWSLGSLDATANALASRAISKALRQVEDGSDDPEPASVPGAVTLSLGRTTHEDAVAKAETGLEAVKERLPDQYRGVGISAKVVAFPD